MSRFASKIVFFGFREKDQASSWYASLVAAEVPRTTYEDHWPRCPRWSFPYGRCAISPLEPVASLSPPQVCGERQEKVLKKPFLSLLEKLRCSFLFYVYLTLRFSLFFEREVEKS